MAPGFMSFLQAFQAGSINLQTLSQGERIKSIKSAPQHSQPK